MPGLDPGDLDMAPSVWGWAVIITAVAIWCVGLVTVGLWAWQAIASLLGG